MNIKPEHFADMVAYTDKLVGRFVAKLDSLRIRDHTLLIFLGDNGTGRGTRSMMGDRLVIGGKGTTTDAGMHVPLIVNWPARIATPNVCSDLVDSTDFLPTLLEAAGAEPPAGAKLDGRSFLPQLVGEQGQPREWIYSWYSPRQGTDMTVREFAFSHRYKLYRSGRFFDLGKDMEEKSPLKITSLEGEAVAAAQLLQRALDQFEGARPSELDRAFEQANKGKVKQRAAKAAKTRKKEKK